jgi:hypothetical protein
MTTACSDRNEISEQSTVAQAAKAEASRQADEQCRRELPIMSETAVRQLLRLPDEDVRAIRAARGLETWIGADNTGKCVYATATVNALANGTQYKFTSLCMIDAVGTSDEGLGQVESVKQCSSWKTE